MAGLSNRDTLSIPSSAYGPIVSLVPEGLDDSLIQIYSWCR